jgi:hypothetical protein
MTDESAAEPNAITPKTLRAMAATIGANLTAGRATALAPQAKQHFAQLSQLDAIADSRTEPAAEFRLDRWTTTDSD